MSRLRMLVCVGLVGLSVVARVEMAFAAGAPPNIVFLFADDQRNDVFGHAGHPIIKTPNLDALAGRGVRFTNAFVSHPICWVSRTTILSGLTARSFGEKDHPDKAKPETVNVLYTDLLSAAGYRTAHIGKWHAKMPAGYKPEDHFDVYKPIFRNPYFKEQPDGSLRHETQLIGDEAVKFLAEQPKDQPFSINMWFNASHAEDKDHRPGIGHFPWPKVVDGMYDDFEIPAPRLSDPAIYQSQPQHLKESVNRERYFWRWDTPEKYQLNIRAYYRMISGIDHVVGRVVEALEKEGFADNTIIVYSADNGYYMGDRGFAGKWSHYEESLRVPLIIYDPRQPYSTRGRVEEVMAMNLDFPPTFLDWAGVKIPRRYQGRSLKEVVRGNVPKDWRKDFYCEHITLAPNITWEGVRGERYVYARYFDQEPAYEFLHDLESDPDQLRNLVTESGYSETLVKMRERCDELVEIYGGPLGPIEERPTTVRPKWTGEEEAKKSAAAPVATTTTGGQVGSAFNGKWVAELQTQRGPQKSSFTFNEDNGTLTGVITIQGGSETTIEDGKVEGANISFQQFAKNQDNNFKLAYNGVLKDGAIEFTRTTSIGKLNNGILEFTSGQGNRTKYFTATRVPGGPFDGTWVTEFQNPQGIRIWTFTFKEENGNLTGVITMPNDSTAQLHDGKVDGASISFQQTLEARGFDLKYTGILKDDAIEFTRVLPNGTQQFTAKRDEIGANRAGAQRQGNANRAPAQAKAPRRSIPANTNTPPNIVLIISDDQAWSDYSFMGHSAIETPSLDKLAAQSLTFTRGYVPDSLCRPSLTTIITGMYPHQTNIVGNDPPVPPQLGAIRAREARGHAAYLKVRNEYLAQMDHLPALPRLLAQEGYVSHQSGKWWEGHYSRAGFTHGMTHGDRTRGGRAGDGGLLIGRERQPNVVGAGDAAILKFLANGDRPERIAGSMEPIYDFIDQAQEANKPFFVWYAPLLPHTPHTPPQRLLDKYIAKTESIRLARYWAMCERFDETVGQLVDHIDQRGLGENTIVLYVADNGWIQPPDRGGYGPRSKREPHEGGIRTPIMVRWRGKVAPRTDTQNLASSIDLAPTILKASGLPVPAAMTGVDLLDQNAVDQREEIFGEIFEHDIVDAHRPLESLRFRWVIQGDWKLIAPNAPREPEAIVELYNLKSDPHELNNLADQHPKRVAQLMDKLDGWLKVGG